MGLAIKVEATIDAEEYLRREETSPLKHEYLAGAVYAMAGASERHNRIAGNAFFRFRLAARGSHCGVFISDMKLRIAAVDAFYYPDVMVVCGEDAHPLYKTAPCVIVEVISPTTAAIDRREKWFAYRQIASLSAYLLVESERRAVSYWLRDADGAWRAGTLEENETLTLSCPPLTIPVALDDFYEDVEGLAA